MGSTHCPLQASRLALQVAPQTPAAHSCPAAQNVPQPPQLKLSVWVSTQSPKQFCWLCGQTVVQAPLSQVLPVGQALPHRPQLALSVLRSTQWLAHSVSPPAQEVAHLPPEQT